MPSLSRGARIQRALHLLNPTMSYFSVDGLVSGIKSHMIEGRSKCNEQWEAKRGGD